MCCLGFFRIQFTSIAHHFVAASLEWSDFKSLWNIYSEREEYVSCVIILCAHYKKLKVRICFVNGDCKEKKLSVLVADQLHTYVYIYAVVVTIHSLT